MGSVADFTQSETWAIENTLKQRWPKQPTELQLADVEIKMFPDDRAVTLLQVHADKEAMNREEIENK